MENIKIIHEYMTNCPRIVQTTIVVPKPTSEAILFIIDMYICICVCEYVCIYMCVQYWYSIICIHITFYTQPISVSNKNKGVCVIGINDSICLLRFCIIVYIYIYVYINKTFRLRPSSYPPCEKLRSIGPAKRVRRPDKPNVRGNRLGPDEFFPLFPNNKRKTKPRGPFR